MTLARKKLLSLAIGLGISIALMWVLFKEIDFGKLGDALADANYWWLLPNMGLIIFSMYLRAYRWAFMLKPVKRVDYGRLLSATYIGFMANNVLPLRLGEFVRAYSLAYQDREVSKSASLATIFVERMVFDLVALLLIFGIVIGVTSVHVTDSMKTGIYICIAVALAGLTFVLTLALRPNQAGAIITRYLPETVAERSRAVVLRFSQGLEFLMRPRVVLSVTWQTLLIWLIMGVSNYFVFVAFGFDLPLDASFFLLVVVSIAILIPSSPGFVGVYHGGTVFTLLQYGISPEKALSFALVLHAAQYIPITFLGFYYLRKSHLTLRQLEDEAVD